MILLVYGTRPEWIKIKPLIDEFKNNNIKHKILFTGQHENIVNGSYDYNHNFIDYNPNRLNNILMNCLNIPEDVFKDITHILVQGDTTSALAMAINGMNRKIKIIHLEAGLRTFNIENPYPEEFNRKLISQIADIHLCPTVLNFENLQKEGVTNNVFAVGNTVLDNLKEYKDKTYYSNRVLITLHRRENHDKIDEWFTIINQLAIVNPDIEFILPIHPNPNVLKHKDILTHVTVVNPLNHHDLLTLMCSAKFIITDSGGIQEEASFLNKKVIICRTLTERPESLNISSELCVEPKDLKDLFYKFLNDFEINIENCPYGNGTSSLLISKLLNLVIYDK